jgi:uncharacterized protein
MLMSEAEFPDGTPISGYGAGVFSIAGRVHYGGLLIVPDYMGTWSPADPVRAADVAPIVEKAREIDVLLIGLGPDIAILPRDVREALDSAGLAFDVMATPAACRTYNVLLAENRRVAAALLPV